MPNNGETKYEYTDLNAHQLAELILKYNEILNSHNFDIITRKAADTGTACSVISILAAAIGVTLAAAFSLVTVSVTAYGWTEQLITSQMRSDLSVLNKALVEMNYRGADGLVVQFKEQYTYKRTKMWGDYFEAWYSTSNLIIDRYIVCYPG